MIRIDAMWLAVEPIDMRAGAERLLARVVQVFGAAQVPPRLPVRQRARHPHQAARARRLRRVVRGAAFEPGTLRVAARGIGAAPATLTQAQFDALVLGCRGSAWSRWPSSRACDQGSLHRRNRQHAPMTKRMGRCTMAFHARCGRDRGWRPEGSEPRGDRDPRAAHARQLRDNASTCSSATSASRQQSSKIARRRARSSSRRASSSARTPSCGSRTPRSRRSPSSWRG